MSTLVQTIQQISDSFSKMIFFVGAGISADSGLPNFSQLNKKILELITCEDSEEIAKLRPEVVLQTMKKEIGSGFLSFLEMFCHKDYKPNINHFLMSEILKQGGKIITTNWDDLIEKACESRNVSFNVCHTLEDFRNLVNKDGKENKQVGTIFKIHGNIVSKNTDHVYDSIQATLDDVGKGLDENKRMFLEQCLQESDFCFMGYSAMDDFDILPILTETKSDRSIFWIKHDRECDNYVMTRKEIEEESRRISSENEKYDQIMNVNEILLGRDQCMKVIIHTGDFSFELLHRVGFSNAYSPTIIKNTTYRFDKKFSNLSNSIDQNKRDFILSDLYEKCGNGSKAEEYLTRIIMKNDSERAEAHYRLAGTYNRLFGISRSDEVIQNYRLALENTQNIVKKAEILVSLANFHRRVFGVSKMVSEYIRNAEKLINFDNYPSYLNVKALVCYGLGDLDDAEQLAEKGLKRRMGNVAGIAESLNALGLIMMKKAEREKSTKDLVKTQELLMCAIKHFETALDNNRRIGSFRSCGQQCHNLISCNTKLLEICFPDEIDRYLTSGKEWHKRGLHYWGKLSPKPPLEEISEIDVRYAELLIAFGRRISEYDSRRESVEQEAREKLTMAMNEYHKLGLEKRAKRCDEILRSICVEN